MDCLEFRRRLGSEPGADDPAFVAHRDACAACRDAWTRAQQLDTAIARALAVPVPDGLADRVLLRQTTRAREDQSRHARRHVAWRIAAGLVLAVGGLTLYGVSRPASALPDLAVAHLVHEPYALTAHGLVDPGQVAAVFRARGVELRGPAVTVNYLNLCSLARDAAVHLVMQRPEGPVTVYFVVGRHDVRESDWQRGAQHGRTVPLAGGTLVMLASDPAGFDAIEREWRRLIG